MSKFIIHKSDKKKKRESIIAWTLIFSGLVFLAISVLTGKVIISPVLNIIITLDLLWSGIGRLRKKQKQFFIEIDGIGIHWLLNEFDKKPAMASWQDTRWIKQEHDTSITIYQDSSFSKNIQLTAFPDKDKKEIVELIVQQADQKNVRLVNFSEQPLAVA